MVLRVLSLVYLLGNNYIDYQETPIKECLDYTQEVQNMSRIDVLALEEWLKKHIKNAENLYKDEIKIIVILERPMVNPQRFKQSRICFTRI